MKRIRLPFLAALLAAVSLSPAQTKLPARQVGIDANGFAYLSAASNESAQAAFDFLDANWDPRPSAASWSNLPTNAVLSQDVFDWIDLNWMAVDASAFVAIPTNAETVQAVFEWMDVNWSLDPDAWDVVAPTNASNQSAWTWLDDWLSGLGAGDGLMKGTNVAGAVFNPANDTWEGLGNMPGTNVAGATYNPTNKTWEGLGTMPGTNVFWATNANGTWTLLNMSSNLHACVVGAGAAGGSPVLTNGSSGAHIRLDDEIDQIVSDPGGWWDDGDDEMVLPVDGEYEFLFWAQAANCHVRPTATNDASAGYFQIGSGEWGTPVAGTAISMWSVRQTFDAGTRFQFYVLPDADLNSTTRVDVVRYHVYLVGPKLDGAY